MNLTITVDEEVLKQARLRAVEHGTSVNAVLREYLEEYAGTRTKREQAARAILALSKASRAGHEGKRWTREELHER